MTTAVADKTDVAQIVREDRLLVIWRSRSVELVANGAHSPPQKEDFADTFTEVLEYSLKES